MPRALMDFAGDFEGVKWAANLELKEGGDTLRGGRVVGNGGGLDVVGDVGLYI